jgi:hypothetical protein
MRRFSKLAGRTRASPRAFSGMGRAGAAAARWEFVDTLFGGAASAPAVGGGGGSGGGGRGKPTVWGQGMSRVRRRPFIGSSSAAVGVPGHGTLLISAAAAKRDVAADVASRPAAPSLMSIVEEVSRSNRGWSEELKMRKSVGRKRTARANLLDGIVVRVPPFVLRGALVSLLHRRRKPQPRLRPLRNTRNKRRRRRGV